MDDNNKDAQGRFVVGNQASKGRGRPAGSKNRSSERIRQFFSDFIENNMGELNDSFSALRPREKFSVLLEMAKYILPTMRAQGDLIDELSDVEIVPLEQNEVDVSGMAAEVQRLFEEDKIYLNPKLKLSDVALAVGTNRTYLSRYFNRQNGQTFYDYVNSYRIQYAENLLKSTNFPLPEIAIKSGFNSISTFRRVFFASFGCSPNKYRVNA